MTKKYVPIFALALALLWAAMVPAARAACTPSSQFGGWYACVPTVPAVPAVTPAPSTQPAGAANQSGLAAQVVAETNAERAKYGLKPLAVDADLAAAALIRAREIAQVFSHTRPDGSSCFTVSKKAFGENIARGHNSVNRVMAAWMSSEGHRANILRASYGSIGAACVQVNGIYCWVQLFGR